MQKLEQLTSIIPDVKVTYDHLMPKALAGLYSTNRIRLNARNDYYKNVEVLAEEIGHHYTSFGDISDYSNINSMKQEHRARRYAIKLILPLEKLIECYHSDVWGDKYEICTHLEITPEYFDSAVKDYIKKFGHYVKYDGYKISFEPLSIKKLY